MTVAPIIGAPDAVAKQIQQEFTSAVEKQRVAVSTGKDERADYTLRGYIVAAKDKNATKVSYIWDVTDPTGKRVNRITGEEVVSGNASKDPWAAITPHGRADDRRQGCELVRRLAAEPGGQRRSPPAQPASVGAQPVGCRRRSPAAGSRSAEPPARPPPRRRRRAAAQPSPTTGSIGRDGAGDGVVPSVTGAPGDGSTSLTAAIQRELSGQGRGRRRQAGRPPPIASRARSRSARPRTASSRSRSSGWCSDPQGKKLGTVSQRNEIPEGSLDGAWGRTAEQAAGAAAQGIVKLLPQHKAVN